MTQDQPTLIDFPDPTQRMRERAGTADPATLPHSCGRCPNRWSGTRTAHCPTCHNSFGGVSAFDLHRRGGNCTHPTSLGMVPLPGRAFECWGFVTETEEAA